MTFFVALAATSPTAPTISVANVSSSSIRFTLVSPSTEPQTGIGSYNLLVSTVSASGPWTTIANVSSSAFTTNSPYTWSGASPSTTYYCAAQGVDNSSQHSTSPLSNVASITTPNSGVITNTFPQIGTTMVGGSRQYNSATTLTYMKHMDVVLYQCQDGWEIATGGTMAAFTTATQSGSLMPNGTKMISYFNPTNLTVGTTPYNVLSASNMMLVAAYPSNLTITSNGSYKVSNICTVGSQPTVTSGTPPVTRNANTYIADYSFDIQANGGALGLAGNPVGANPTVYGFFTDDFNCYPIAGSGDYLRNNTTQAGGTDSTTPQALALRQGFATLVARYKTNKPGLKVFANLSGSYNNPLTTGVQGVLDGGLAEHSMGDLFSVDTQSSWANMMTVLTNQYALCAPGALITFSHSNVTDSGSDFWRPGPGQAVRYGLASALMAGCVYSLTPTGNTPNTTTTSAFNNNEYDSQRYGSAQWFDEFSVSPVTLIAFPYNDPYVFVGMHWMGTEIDTGIVTTAWQNGVVRKRYQMANGRQCWVLLNPRNNGAQTINLGQRMQAISGTQVPAVNNGNTNITTIAIPDADARFLVTYP